MGSVPTTEPINNYHTESEEPIINTSTIIEVPISQTSQAEIPETNQSERAEEFSQQVIHTSNRYQSIIPLDSPVPYEAINCSTEYDENTPLLYSSDPPPDYTDPDAFAELPTYEEVQDEIDSDEEGADMFSILFFIILIIIITTVNVQK